MRPPLRDPRALCIICKAPASPARPGSTFEGQGDNAMIVTFFVHDACRGVMNLRLPDR